MDAFAEVRRCLVDMDVAGIKRAWSALSPHLPQPASDKDTIVCLHMARTSSASVPLKMRAYSHCWLLDHGLPSQLPDQLKPKAERIYPRIVSSVGVSVSSKFPVIKKAVERAMSDAVSECYADNRTEPVFVRSRMNEARARELRGLGILTPMGS